MSYRTFITARFLRKDQNLTYASSKNYWFELSEILERSGIIDVGVIGKLNNTENLIEITGKFRIEKNTEEKIFIDLDSGDLKICNNNTSRKSSYITIKSITSFEKVARVMLTELDYVFNYFTIENKIDSSVRYLSPHNFCSKYPLQITYSDDSFNIFESIRSIGDYRIEKYTKSTELMSNTATNCCRVVDVSDPTITNSLSSIKKNWLTCNGTAYNCTSNEANEAKISIENLRKEDKKMKFLNDVDFGKATDFAYSPNGIAVKTTGNNYVTYDINSHSITDVTDFVIDIGNFFYKIPVAINDITVGDIICHKNRYMFVIDTFEDEINVVDPISSEVRLILPIKNIFGFNYYTKVISLFPCNNIFETSSETPFGNILPFMLMKDEKEIDSFLPMMLMIQNNQNNKNNVFGDMNPLMFMLMKENSDFNKILPFMLMNNYNLNKCNCNSNCNCNNHKNENN